MRWRILAQNLTKFLLAFFFDSLYTLMQLRRCVGMVDEADSKSVVREDVWVRVPPPAPCFEGLKVIMYFQTLFHSMPDIKNKKCRLMLKNRSGNGSAGTEVYGFDFLDFIILVL